MADDRTEVGSYFIANYPPFSTWTREAVDRDVRPALASPPTDVPLGLYLHIPFCRKRCQFCYFRVYTDKNAKEVQAYLDTLAREWELYAAQPAVSGRPLNFVYFGGGTPSFLSTRQLQSLVSQLDATPAGRVRSIRWTRRAHHQYTATSTSAGTPPLVIAAESVHRSRPVRARDTSCAPADLPRRERSPAQALPA